MENEPRKHRGLVTALIVSFIIALLLVGVGVYFMHSQEQQNEMRAYRNAMKSTEPLVLQNFLDMYADAPAEHIDSVKTYLASLRKVDTDWADALVSNNRYAFQRFLKLHPQSVYSVEANIKIDSLDWVAAVEANTTEAIQRYLSSHSDGAYYDEAQALLEKLESQQLTPEDRQMVIQLFTSYFDALATMDESVLAAVIAPVMTSFLHRENATIVEVSQYMQKLHEPDITKMAFTLNNDWNIEKQPVGIDRYVLKVSFSVTQNIERTDHSRESALAYKIIAQVNADGCISELNMKRSVLPASSAD